MRNTIRFWLSVSAAATLLLLFPASNIAGDSQDDIDVAKQGKITLRVDHKVGDQTLKAGDYKVNHRASGSGHFIHFTPVGRRGAETIEPVQCKLEPSGKKVTQTRVDAVTEAGMRRIVSLKVRGNNAAFVF